MTVSPILCMHDNGRSMRMKIRLLWWGIWKRQCDKMGKRSGVRYETDRNRMNRQWKCAEAQNFAKQISIMTTYVNKIQKQVIVTFHLSPPSLPSFLNACKIPSDKEFVLRLLRSLTFSLSLFTFPYWHFTFSPHKRNWKCFSLYVNFFPHTLSLFQWKQKRK